MDQNQKQLEEEFLVLCSTFGEQIKAKVALAEKYLNEAVELADKHGLPFNANISALGQAYVPPLYHQRFKSLDKESIAELMDMSQYDLDHRGWERSAIC